MKRLKIALTKGRVEQQVLPLLEAAGIDCTPIRNKQRRLIFDLPHDPYQVILAKGPDVTTFLERGVVDIGIVGSDVLTENHSTQYELLDLKIGRCQFILASTANFEMTAASRKIIGTKYPYITQQYFSQRGEDVEIIKIEGSVELAPLTGLADAIVDITETGTTLKENNLQIYDYLQPVSTRLVVNRQALKQHPTEIYQLVDQLAQVVSNQELSKERLQ